MLNQQRLNQALSARVQFQIETTKKQYTNNYMLEQYCTKTSSLTQVKASFVLSGKVSEILLSIEHVSNFPTTYLSTHLDESRLIVDDLNFLILVQMLWTVDCGANETINLISKNSTFSLKCFFLKTIKTAIKSLMNGQK